MLKLYWGQGDVGRGGSEWTAGWWRINVKQGQFVRAGDVVVVMEAIKMETEIRARVGGTVSSISRWILATPWSPTTCLSNWADRNRTQWED